ncbi:AFG1-like ATPase-domain-containing protein [Stachybotrys elegans]|uniref:AFG1-like ATPase-domain-containing protein n=1 Tax=Stachybotrys elegans TaxID=80388 RepID=A0A8K0SZC3_9HYPO|nr:AFG1-like ATPase-domain-containing protein [Stachybotrys elegans]
MRRFSTAVTITDPLIKYQTLVATGLYSPDPAQHRLAIHLHKIYLRLKDYSPQVEYRYRLSQVARLTTSQPAELDADGNILARRNHSIWRNPLFKHLLPSAQPRDDLSLVRVPGSHESAIEIDSLKGLFLSGEVGTGKSMLLDLLAEGLPTERKKRWHFNTFMLYAFSQLEKHRKTHAENMRLQIDYSLLWFARKLVEDSPILFLDEFQLPDRAASKILSHLFVAFFQLGGVLVASSNRMPEELQKATGIDYAPTRKGIMGKIFGGSTRSRGELYGQTSDFAYFLDVLKARCDFWHMEGAQDWRRRDEVESPEAGVNMAQGETDVALNVTDDTSTEQRRRPYNYHICGEDDQTWSNTINNLLSRTDDSPIPWEPSTIIIYGRKIVSPSHRNGIVLWNFDDLVRSLGPADYVSMASSYHTFIIDQVPIMDLAKKNEARRFITLLDALYEARCKLIIRAQNPPDELFFPQAPPSASIGDHADSPENATYSETIAEVYQDQTSPFRPNVSFYDTESSTSKYDPDQDSDFGLQKQPIDFGNTGAFTGEDERFAYKRAVSRLWELCGARWHSRTGEWWQPLPLEARHWEGGPTSQPLDSTATLSVGNTGEFMGMSEELEQPAGLSRWRVTDLGEQEKGNKS